MIKEKPDDNLGYFGFLFLCRTFNFKGCKYLISRVLEGVVVAFFIPSSIASAIDYAPEGRVGEALGWRSLMIGVGVRLFIPASQTLAFARSPDNSRGFLSSQHIHHEVGRWRSQWLNNVWSIN